jgi:hypothetical protein
MILRMNVLTFSGAPLTLRPRHWGTPPNAMTTYYLFLNGIICSRFKIFGN